jgi:hypothetical protein
MRPAIAALAIGALSMSAEVSVRVQTVPSAQASQTEQTVTVEGCLHGKRFTPDLSMLNTALIFSALKVKELHLEGQPGLMKTLEKGHNGHQDEITGVVAIPNNRDGDVSVKSRPAGKRTRVTVISPGSNPDPRAAGSSPRVATNALPSQQWLRMNVTSLRHLNDKCQFAATLFSR